MKNFKYFGWLLFLSLFVLSCEDEDEFENFAENASAPENISALLDVTQDNTGLVTITPTGEGVSHFDVALGDGNTIEAVSIGESIQHTYTEGDYTLGITGYNTTGQDTEASIPLSVSFQAPVLTETPVVVADPLVSNGVMITVNADYAVSYDVETGSDAVEPKLNNPIGSTVKYAYPAQGDYEIVITVKGAAIEKTSYTVTFTSEEIQSPVSSAPAVPTRNSSDYISIYAGDYDNISGVDFYPNWGQSTQFNEYDLSGDMMLQYQNMNYQGMDFGGQIDVSALEFLHFDFWSPDMAQIQVFAISASTGENFVTVDLNDSEWTSADIPLSAFTDLGIAMTDLFQFKFVDPIGGGTVFMDNIYFYTSAPSAPSGPAPTPTQAAGAVISVHSSAYTDITSTEWNPGWGQSTDLETVELDGVPTLHYTQLNYTGIVLDYENPTDISSMDYVHFDYWTPDAGLIGFKTVNTSMPDGATKESQVDVTDITYGEWVSVDIPLSSYTTDPSGITQLLFASDGAEVYIDNLYFYKDVASEPTTVPSAPSQAQADVVSIFSPHYTSVTVNEWNPDWGQTTVLETVQITGVDVLKYSDLNYTGLVLDYGNPTDLTGKTHVRFDYWTPNATTIGFKTVNTSMPDGPTKESEVQRATSLGEWVTVDIPLSEFTTDHSGVTQLLFSSDNSTVYIANLFFY